MKQILSLALFLLAAANLWGQDANASRLSTHVLDLSEGKPAPGIVVSLYRYNFEKTDWVFVEKALTDKDGRISDLLPSTEEGYGAWKLRFETEEHFRALGQKSIYPYIEVVFKMEDPGHYHIPITVSANGYSTYRGS